MQPRLAPTKPLCDFTLASTLCIAEEENEQNRRDLSPNLLPHLSYKLNNFHVIHVIHHFQPLGPAHVPLTIDA